MRHVILGAGPAGVIGAETIRKHAPADEIVILGDEAEPPYSRMAIPYLLMGQVGEPGTYLRHDPAHFEKLRITLKRSRAKELDADKRRLLLDDGNTLGFDTLLIATGSSPIRPPIRGIDLPGVHPCWTLEDARAIARLATKGARVLQMGAGFIGCIIMEPRAPRARAQDGRADDRAGPRGVLLREHRGRPRRRGRQRAAGRPRGTRVRIPLAPAGEVGVSPLGWG